jgi:UDP-N-acetylmuramoyl-L-alanyl-D-glutamate--2,6-diaminopimelate ligase
MMGARRAGAVPLHLSAAVARLEQDGLLSEADAGDVIFTGVTDDSRDARPGDLFCAWSGTSHDAHHHAPDAVAAGAVALLVERRLPELAVPQVVVKDGRRAAALAASASWGDPQDALVLVGVTGTNGKTTSVWILRHVLGARFRTASLGTLGVILDDGSALEGTESLTTPGPVELARTLRLLVDRGVEAVAMEVSSHALAQGRVHSLLFDAALFTNLSRDHLDFHGTLDAYLQAKLRLAELLRPGGWAVTNADDAAWQAVSGVAERTLSFGTLEAAEVRALEVEFDGYGARFRLETAARALDATLPLPGAFNVHNALGAAAVALALGFSPEDVAARLATVPQVPGRLERIADQPCPVLRDYAHTPDALERVLAALRPLVEGRLIVVFGAGGDRDRGKRPLMGAIAEAGADLAIVTSDNPRTEDPDAIIAEIEVGMKRGVHRRVTDRRAAIAEALAMAGPADLILLAGKGHEDYQIIGRDKQSFDERVIVSELLGQMEARA